MSFSSCKYMSLTFEQKFQILSAAGAWVGGLGAFFAAGVAIWIARRSDKIKLRCSVNSLIHTGIGPNNFERLVGFQVTNLGDRPVTINSVGWCVGRKKQKKYCVQTLSNTSPSNLPAKLEYGETATFGIYFSENANWLTEFSKKFIADAPINTLRAQVHTSTGHTENIKPEGNASKRDIGIGSIGSLMYWS